MKTVLCILLLSFLCVTTAPAEDDSSALFNSTCRNCHNSNGDGKTVAGQKMVIPDLRSAAVQRLSDEELFQTIGNGVQHKQYPHTFLRKGISEAQIRQLVTYIRSFRTLKAGK